MKMLKSLITHALYLALAAGCLVTLLAFLGRLWWPFELLSHFRWQYLIYLTIGTGVMAIARLWPGVALSAGFGLVNLVVVAPLFVPPAGNTTHLPTTTPTFRAILFNALYENPYPDQFVDFVQETQPDFIMLLEVAPNFIVLLDELDETYPHYYGQPHYSPAGIALLSRHPLDHAELITIAELGRSSLVATITLDGQPITLVGTHPSVPVGAEGARRRNIELAALGEWVATRPGQTLILADLNTTPWSPYFHDLLETGGLGNGRLGFGLNPTWPTWHPIKIPIDHALTTPGLTVQNFRVGTAPGSDHYPIIVDFALAP